MELKSLLDQPGKLPTIPRITQQLIESFSAPNVSVDAIAAQIAADPALSAKLLRLANSAYFHVSRRISSVEDALKMLGFVMVRNLVIGSGMVTAFRGTPGMDLNQFWRYNLYTACASRWLAGSGDANTDEAFTVGLLHGIGQLQMHVGMPTETAAMDKEMNVLDGARAEFEKQVFGFHHGDVAGELAKLWNFPPPLVLALRNSPQPLASHEFSESSAWVHLGAWRARTELMAMSDEDLVASYPTGVGKRLGIPASWMPALAAQSPGVPSTLMPRMNELTEGLDALLA
ncbi:MAG: HDOD domain-containing protein [Usitatibacteraceae bacterium]